MQIRIHSICTFDAVPVKLCFRQWHGRQWRCLRTMCNSSEGNGDENTNSTANASASAHTYALAPYTRWFQLTDHEQSHCQHQHHTTLACTNAAKSNTNLMAESNDNTFSHTNVQLQKCTNAQMPDAENGIQSQTNVTYSFLRRPFLGSVSACNTLRWYQIARQLSSGARKATATLSGKR